MPSHKKGHAAHDWAYKLLDEADEDKPTYYGQEIDNGAVPSKEAAELVQYAKEETNGLSHHSEDDASKFITTWEGVLTDASAVKSKEYVARAFADAVAHGPKQAWDRIQTDRDTLLASAKEWQHRQSSGK